MDRGKMLTRTMSSTISVDIHLFVSLDSRDLFTSPKTQRNSVQKSTHCDVNDTRYAFEWKNVSKLVWIPGQQNQADTGTKNDSPILDSLRLTFETGHLQFDFRTATFCSSNHSLG